MKGMRAHLLQPQRINLSQVFAGQNVGIEQVGDEIWLVTFMDYDLGYFDDETGRLEPVENPFPIPATRSRPFVERSWRAGL
jgi:hypothetical protein